MPRSNVPWKGLGVYMKNVGACLPEPPGVMSVADAQQIIRFFDVGYAFTTLHRLVKRGIAKDIGIGYVRGPNWELAAKNYGWADFKGPIFHSDADYVEWVKTKATPTEILAEVASHLNDFGDSYYRTLLNPLADRFNELLNQGAYDK